VPDLSHDAALAVESLILGLCLAGKTEERELKIALTSAVQLSRVAGPEIRDTLLIASLAFCFNLPVPR
jgi:integrator complex subunit 7